MTTSPEPDPIPERDRFIPLSKAQLVDALVARDHMTHESRNALERIARWFSLLFHLRFFNQREALKDAYANYDPDQPGTNAIDLSPAERSAFFQSLEPSLEAANFRRLTAYELDPSNATDRGRVRVQIKVPHDDFAEVRFYGRGRRKSRYTYRVFFGLRERQAEAFTYDYVVFCAAVANPMPRAARQSKLRPGALYLKLFRDIPQGDLTTLYPNARVVMKMQDKFIIGLPALIGGIPILINILPALSVLFIVLGAYLGLSGVVEEDSLKKALAALSGLAALGGFLLRQWTKYERQTLRYQKQVLDNAYFNNINNNRGFFDFLIGASEDSEVKEALLAYDFLLTEDAPISKQELDQKVEAWLLQKTGYDVDFEIDDALRKLRELKLVSETTEGLTTCAPDEAEANCRAEWDQLADRLSRVSVSAD